MAYRSRSLRRKSRKSKRQFITTIILSLVILYATLNWILPSLITGVGFITNFFRHPPAPGEDISANPTLAPPVLNIPYEATNTAQINVNGYSVAGAKVEIYRDNELQNTTQALTDGSFQVSMTLLLGTNNIYGKTVDDKGQKSLASKTIRLIYDNEKPKLTVSSPQNGQNISGERKITVSGTTEPNLSIQINNSQAIVDSDGNFSATLSLSDGDNTLTITAQDQAGNATTVTEKVHFQP